MCNIIGNKGVFADAVARDVADNWKSWFINVDEHKRNMLYQLVFDTIKEWVDKYDESYEVCGLINEESEERL